MCQRYLLLALVVLILSAVSVNSQSSDSATNHYNSGTKKIASGDWDGAIEDYSRAIVLSSRPTRSKRLVTVAASSFTGETEEASNITVIDPLTADAYNNRGVARYRKGDIEGAIADVNGRLQHRRVYDVAEDA